MSKSPGAKDGRNRHPHSQVYRTPPRGFKVKKDRKVMVSEVPCPTCGAQVGEQCKSSNHISRRRMALRKERGEL